MPTPDPSTEYEFWKAVLPFAGAVIGSFLGSPLIEYIKDRISAKRAWGNQRKEIIERIRYVSGNLQVFSELIDRCIGYTSKIEKGKIQLNYQLIKEFDAEPLSKAIQQLTILAPRDAEISGTGQLLVEQTIHLLALVKAAKSQKNDEDLRIVLNEFDFRVQVYNLFLEDEFASLFDIKDLSVGVSAQRASFYIRAISATRHRSGQDINALMADILECAEQKTAERERSAAANRSL